jgi:hypothetical protein
MIGHSVHLLIAVNVQLGVTQGFSTILGQLVENFDG